MTKRDNPIKVIRTGDSDHRPPGAITVKKKVFGDGATTGLRRTLARESIQLLRYFQDDFNRWPAMPAVAKVVLREEALAKSHRPDALFSPTSCPIIGTLGYGELLISVTRGGIYELINRFRNNKTKVQTANISTIKKIVPYTASERLLCYQQNTDKPPRPIKIRLFDHKHNSKNNAIQEALNEFLEKMEIPFTQLNYGNGKIYVIKGEKYSDISDRLSGFIGLRSIAPMPSFRALNYHLQMTTQGEADILCFPPPDPSEDYPLVGVIDSGICPENTLLAPWVVARESYVPQGKENYCHGTMVAGLIANSRALNHGDSRFPSAQAKLVDINVFPEKEDISEDDLVAILSEVVAKYPKVKVWNLSLGASGPSQQYDFSDFARFLDRLHDDHHCLFVVAAGNQNDLKKWPTALSDPMQNRISSPADSVRALTVGSVAHISIDQSLSLVNEASPFSRVGPGPCYIPKPEISHYGGNATADGKFAQQGMLSLGPKNRLIESIGTSFAAPIASSVAANVYHFVSKNNEIEMTSELAKALVVHSALLGSEKVDSTTINQKGFGIPGDVKDNLYCDPNCITMIFKTDVRHGGFEFEKFPMPIPECLITNDGKFRGEMLMTLVYSPLVDESYASEYCRTNVEVGLGSYIVDPSAPEKLGKFSSKIPLSPKLSSDMYEKEQISNGFKWSPVKAYRKQFPRGIAVDTWRLRMKVSRRAEEPTPQTPQKAVLLVSLRGLHGENLVYNQTVQLMNRIGWSSIDVDQHVRVRQQHRN